MKPFKYNALSSGKWAVAHIVQYREQEAVRTEQLDFREVGCGQVTKLFSKEVSSHG